MGSRRPYDPRDWTLNQQPSANNPFLDSKHAARTIDQIRFLREQVGEAFYLSTGHVRTHNHVADFTREQHGSV